MDASFLFVERLRWDRLGLAAQSGSKRCFIATVGVTAVGLVIVRSVRPDPAAVRRHTGRNWPVSTCTFDIAVPTGLVL
jgi:hypothetical protein